MSKTVRIWNDDFDTMLTDIPNFNMLDYDEEKPEVQVASMEIKGKDGVQIGKSNFGTYNLIVRFWYKGADLKDYNMLKERLRGILFTRKPYYINHSDSPAKKYGVYCEDVSIEDIGSQYGTFEVSFVVYKGYSESLDTTLSVDFLTDNWAFESGLITDRDIKYKHNTKRFEIFNGSNDIIDPLQNHRFNIRIKASAPDGLVLRNHMNNTEFRYYGSLASTDVLEINGVHPILNGTDRVGINTNYSWLTLVPNMNNIEIEGNNLVIESVEFDFNFVYR